jgi:hypothetical protein
MCEEVPDGGGRQVRLRRDQLEGAKIVVAGASRSTNPCSHSCITATAVKILVSDAMRKTVSSVIGVFAATSASPWPWNHARAPSAITATANPAHGLRSRT